MGWFPEAVESCLGGASPKGQIPECGGREVQCCPVDVQVDVFWERGRSLLECGRAVQAGAVSWGSSVVVVAGLCMIPWNERGEVPRSKVAPGDHRHWRGCQASAQGRRGCRIPGSSDWSSWCGELHQQGWRGAAEGAGTLAGSRDPRGIDLRRACK